MLAAIPPAAFVAFGVVWLFLIVFMLALARAAAMGDEMLERQREHDERRANGELYPRG